MRKQNVKKANKTAEIDPSGHFELRRRNAIKIGDTKFGVSVKCCARDLYRSNTAGNGSCICFFL